MQQQPTDLDQRIPDQAVPYFRLYRKMVLNRNKAEHHHMYLTTCIDTNLTAKGLQTQVAPQVPDQDFEFSIKWEHAHLQISKELTILLCEYYKNRIDKTKLQITKAHDQLTKLCNQQQLNHIDNIIQGQEAVQQQTLKERRDKKTSDKDPIPTRKKRPMNTQLPSTSTSTTNMFQQH